MNTRDVVKLQYEKGQQIKATNVNDQMKVAFTRFNAMGPTDTAPLTTGQFRVFEPRKGMKLVPLFTDNTQWYPTGSCTVANFDTFNLTSDTADGAMVLGALAGFTPQAILTVGHRYQCYYYLKNSGGVQATVKVYNAYTVSGEVVHSESIAAGYHSTKNTFSFMAKTAYFAIGGRSSGASVAIDIDQVLSFGSARGIFLFDWTDNRWLIPNYCGYMSPSTDQTIPAIGSGPIDLRSNHALMCQAIKKEVDTANEVLSHI